MKQVFMMDVDTGVDDAAALALAVGKGVDLVAVSTVAGNVPVDNGTRNSLAVLSFLGSEWTPVYRGASRPLTADYVDAVHVHGGNGLGDADVPDSAVIEQTTSGPEAIIAMAERFAGELTLVATGPLTNVAIALSLRPRIVSQIKRLVVMGGAFFQPGNITPHAEYNIYTDPDAARHVFHAAWNEITAVGLDVTHQVVFSEAMWRAIPDDATDAAWLMRAIARRTYSERNRRGFFLHDPLALGVALDPSYVETVPCTVSVTTTGEERGKTSVTHGGNVLVAKSVHAERFLNDFADTLRIPCLQDNSAFANAE